MDGRATTRTSDEEEEYERGPMLPAYVYRKLQAVARKLADAQQPSQFRNWRGEIRSDDPGARVCGGQLFQDRVLEDVW